MTSGQGQIGRPAWRRFIDFPLVALVIAFVAMLLSGAIGSAIVRSLSLDNTIPSIALKATITVGLAVLAYKLVVVRLGERRRDDLVASGGWLRDLGIGLAGGALLFSAVVGMAALLGVYRVTGLGDPREFLIALLVFGLVPGVTEEILARGVLSRFIAEFGGSWAALAITSLLFGLAHIANPNATLFSSLAIALEAGVLLGGAYMLTGNLWLAIGLHAGWNVTQGGTFGVPVSGFQSKGLLTSELHGDPLLSGGTFGLEASLIAVVLVTGAGAWLVWLAVKRGQVVLPWWTERRLARQQAEALPAA